jgi:DNA modification methylase
MRDDLLMLAADARRIPLADNSVQCIVTSPPYWGLRKYAGEQDLVWEPRLGEDRSKPRSRVCDFHGHEWGGQIPPRATVNLDTFFDEATGTPKFSPERIESTQADGHGAYCRRCGAWRGAYGLEPSIEMYVAHSVEILRECRRVLRPDGVLFWNLGDSYAASRSRGSGGNSVATSPKQRTNGGSYFDGDAPQSDPTLKPKDLCLIPERVALAAQVDGWWVRSRIIWSKPNPMPESVTDRPTDAFEFIWMLTKSERYFWDADAVREPADPANIRKDMLRGPKNALAQQNGQFSEKAFSGGFSGYRNMRNVWTFPTQPYAGAHFATFPEEIPRRAILAATSAKGACVQCGAPWQRVTKASGGNIGPGKIPSGTLERGKANGARFDDGEGTYRVETIGWQPTCLCRGQHGRTAPCVVLDPFGGSGTTGRVAVALRRRAVLLDLAYTAEYAELARQRTSQVQIEML